jgi:lantibiotic modifying enzyme
MRHEHLLTNCIYSDLISRLDDIKHVISLVQKNGPIDFIDGPLEVLIILLSNYERIGYTAKTAIIWRQTCLVWTLR